MLSMNLRDTVVSANNRKIAIGHFNFAELTVLKAAVLALRQDQSERRGDVIMILGMSEKEREFLGEEILISILGSRTSSRKFDFPLFFNADHTKSLEKAKEAVAMGFDSITFDNSHLPLEENIKNTKEVVEYVKSINKEILVEGEIGYIGEGSQLREAMPSGIQLTTPEDAARFVQETGVDMLAPAVGNVHGIIKTGEPKLDIERIAQIHKILREAQHDTPLVLHGASGNTDDDIRAAIKAGVSIVHISTEIRLAWRNALADFLQKNPDEVAPYKILAPAEAAVYEVIMQKLRLFNFL